jgi:putative transposase
MHLEANRIYHVYNQGNRKQSVFFKHEHYLRFLVLVRRYISGNCTVLAYCLMPNHYHFLIQTNIKSIAPKKVGNIVSTELSNGFRMLQSSFAQVINVERNETGSLFKQKAQAKLIDESDDQLLNVFNYIHQNPVKAGLASELSDWEYSSFRDFAGIRKGTIPNTSLALQLTGLEGKEFLYRSNNPVSEEVVKKIF